MRRRVLFTEVRLMWESGAERIAMQRNGYARHEHLNFIIDATQSKDILWSRVKSSVRQNVRKCERQGFQVRELTGANAVDVLYDFLKSTYRRAEVPLSHRSMFDAACKILGPKQMVDLIAVYDRDTPLAAYIMLVYKSRIFFWYGGSVRMPGVWPVDLLHWHEICKCHDLDFEYYDFGGAGEPHIPYGVRDYKAKFGGDLVNYGRYRKVYAPLKLALAERAYSVGRGLISRK
jgi:lipid II:glycine glycyltransferase (peptidoglycan interpeptide bridge formation enzyme)